VRKRLLAGLALAAAVAMHDHALSSHRKRLDELEGRVDNFRRGLQTERRLIDQINDDFDKLLVVTLPVAAKAKQWLRLLDERPGVVAARAELQAWLAEAREREA
jgi:hypothetical protein